MKLSGGSQPRVEQSRAVGVSSADRQNSLLDDETSSARREFHRLTDETLGPAGSGAALELLAAVVVAHPLRDADDGGVVRRHLVLVAELVGPVDRRDPAPGPLAVVGDQ